MSAASVLEVSSPPDRPTARTPAFTTWATVACCAAMMGLGLLWASYGPAIPQLQREFGVGDAAAGMPLALQSAGSVLGALAVPLLLRRLGSRAVFGTAFIALGLGAAAIAGLPSWAGVLSGAVVAGVGLGCCDTLISQSFIVAHGRRGAAMVNVAHGCFGVGTVLAPALLAVLGAGQWRMMFLVVVGLVLFAATGIPGIARSGATATGLGNDPTKDRSAARTQRPGRVAVVVLAGFLVLYIAHFGVQSGIGSWEPTRLMDQGYSEWQATGATSGFWLAVVIGRFAAIPVVTRFRPAAVVILSCVGMAVALAVAALVPESTVWAYLAAGLMIGPIFPTGLTWLMTSGHAGGGTFSYVVASALAGSIVLPPVLGFLFEARGTQTLAPTLLVVAAVAVVAALMIARALTSPSRVRQTGRR